jgi:hypothetical protein
MAAAENVDAIVSQVVDELRTEFANSLLAVVLAGSAAHPATLRPSSDIDLFAIVAVDWFQRRRLLRGGVDVDLFVECPARLDVLISPVGNVAYLSALSDGRILADTNEIALRYVSIARQIYRSFTPLPTDADRFMLRLRARTMLDNVRTLLLADPESARFLLIDLAAWAPQAAVCARGGWSPSEKASIRTMRARFPDLYEHLSAMVDDGATLLERLNATEHYYRMLLGDDVLTAKEFIGPKAPFGLRRRVMAGGTEAAVLP